MIEYIKLKNFQKHEDSLLEFKEGVTYITGVNGAGKSTYLRAISWVALNEGDSKSFRRTYEENDVLKTSSETSVEIGVDGHIIKRVLSNSKNEYWVDGEKCTGFGRGVPASVSKIFNLSDLNIAEQFSPLFLIGESSGGTVAKELNEVASLEEMDILLSNVNTDVRQNNANVSACEEAIQKCEEELTTLKAHVKLYDEAGSLIGEFNDCMDNTEVTVIKEAVDNLRKTDYIGKAKPMSVELKSFTITDADFIYNDTSAISHLLAEYGNLPKGSIAPVPCGISEDMFSIEDLSELKKGIKRMDELKVSMQNALKDKADIEAELSTFSVCPLCGNNLKECDHA